LRAAVFAYHEIGYVCLEELISFGAEVSCLFTHVDDPNEEVWFRNPAELAEQKGIPIYTPDNLKKPSWVAIISDMKPDVIFSFYYRNMIPVEILSLPTIGAFNLHGSLLPKFRGRCPVNWVLIEGEKRTGLTLHYMVEKPDAGDIIAQRPVDISFDDTAYTLFMKMAGEAKTLMKEILPRIRNRSFTRTPQSGLGPSSYFGGRKPEDGLISWQKEAISIYNLTRAVTHPYPGAFTFLDGKKFSVWKAYPLQDQVNALPGFVVSTKPLIVNTGKGTLKLITVQLEGEDEIDGEVFAANHTIENKILGGNT
jgi:methionyl-tRNA formyltransferase